MQTLNAVPQQAFLAYNIHTAAENEQTHEHTVCIMVAYIPHSIDPPEDDGTDDDDDADNGAICLGASSSFLTFVHTCETAEHVAVVMLVGCSLFLEMRVCPSQVQLGGVHVLLM